MTGVPMGASGGAGGMAMNYPQHSLGDGPALAAGNQEVRTPKAHTPPLLTLFVDSSITDNMVTELDRRAAVFATVTLMALAPAWATQEGLEAFLLPELSTTATRHTTLEAPARV